MTNFINRYTVLDDLKATILRERKIAGENHLDIKRYFYNILLGKGYEKKALGTYYLATVMYAVYCARDLIFDDFDENGKLVEDLVSIYKDRIGNYKPFNLFDKESIIYSAIQKSFAVFGKNVYEKISESIETKGESSLNSLVYSEVKYLVDNFDKARIRSRLKI